MRTAILLLTGLVLCAQEPKTKRPTIEDLQQQVAQLQQQIVQKDQQIAYLNARVKVMGTSLNHCLDDHTNAEQRAVGK